MTDERLRLVAELQNRASAEIRKLNRDLGSVKTTASMGQTKTWFSQLSAASDTASKSVRPLAGGLNMIGAGGLAAGLSIAGLISQFRDLAKALPALQELSRQTGMSRTEIERLKATASNLNVDPSKMQASLSGFSRMMVEFHKRSGTFYEEMANHGASGLAEKIRQEDPAAAYRDVLKYLAAIPDAAQRAGRSAADAVQIQRHWAGEAFGDEDMAQVVAKGFGGFEDAYKQAAKDVHEITDETVKAAEAFDRSIASFERTWKDFETTVGPTVFDNLRHATDDFREVFDTIKSTMTWFDKVKDHPVQAVAEAARKAIHERAIENQKHPDGIALDVPSWTDRAISAVVGDGRDPERQPETPSVAPPAARQLYTMPPTEEDRATRARDVGGPPRASTQPPPAFRTPAAYDREMRARKPADDLDGFVVGSLDRPVLHLANTLRTASAAISENGIRPAAFHPAALGASMAAMDPVEAIAAGTRIGVLAAMRELQGETSESGGTLGGFSAAAAGIPNMRFGRSPGGGYRGTPGSAAAGGGEGGSRSWRNNNPGNISMGKFATAHGADGSDGRFAHFTSYEAGRKAQEDLWFNSDTYKGLSLAQAVSKWSPPSENDTAGIIKNYAAATGLDATTPLSQFTPEQRAKLLDAQQAREGWRSGSRTNGIMSASAVKAAEVKDDTPEVAAARKYLAETATGAAAQRADSISKMNPAFALKAAQAIREARAAGLTNAGVFSGYRTPGQTGSAYDRARMSGHSFGIAADFSGVGSPGSPESRAFDAITSRLGLGGYGPDNLREFNHKELFGAHLEKLPPILGRLQATLGPDGSMVNPAETWAAAGVPVPKGAQPSFPEVPKTMLPELAKRTLTAFLAPLGGKPGMPMGLPDGEPQVSEGAYKDALARLPGFQNRRLTAVEKAQSNADNRLMDRYHSQGGAPVKVDVTDSSAARLGTHVGRQLPAWMKPGANGPLTTNDWRDPKFAPKPAIAPLPYVAPEPPKSEPRTSSRDDDPANVHLHLHQDGRVRAIKSKDSPGVQITLHTGRTLTQFA